MENWIKLLKKNDPTLLSQGYICLPRSILNEITSENEAVRHQARIFAALLIKANHTAGYILYKNNKVYCREGELMTSSRLLGAGLNIHYSKIQRTLAKLQQEDFIQVTDMHEGQHIRINNYKEITHPGQKKNPRLPYDPTLMHKEILKENKRIMEEISKANELIAAKKAQSPPDPQLPEKE